MEVESGGWEWRGGFCAAPKRLRNGKWSPGAWKPCLVLEPFNIALQLFILSPGPVLVNFSQIIAIYLFSRILGIVMGLPMQTLE